MSYSFFWSYESTIYVSVSKSLRRDLGGIFFIKFLGKTKGEVINFPAIYSSFFQIY